MSEQPMTRIDQLVHDAAAASAALAAASTDRRCQLLDTIAAGLEAHREELTELAHGETHLPLPRLHAELTRTTGQLRLFGLVLREGSWRDATIDTAGPDLRRLNVALGGPVLVVAASNFPFAFSVAGGDTASALAAGCAVIVKTHDGHAQTSIATAAVVVGAVAQCGFPSGTFSTVTNRPDAHAALLHPLVVAGSFTGSLGGGRALFDLAAGRPAPIPFYAEMGSMNPVVVSPGAVRVRGEAIIDGYVDSFTLGVGQFCTKPGVVFLPEGHGLHDRLRQRVASVAPERMLFDRIREQHGAERERLAASVGVRERVGVPADPPPDRTAPAVFVTDAESMLVAPGPMLTECFGPTSVVVEYGSPTSLAQAIDLVEGSLTATLHAEADEHDFVGCVMPLLAARAGRLVFNGWPTGVAVGWATNHGGPYPATTNAQHTSVGAAAIRRFVRPLCYQDAPDQLLPPPLQNANPEGIIRRIDGTLTSEPVRPAPQGDQR